MRKLVTSLVALTLLVLQPLAHAAHERTIIDLGGIPDRDNWAMGINNAGEVVGVGAFQAADISEMRGLVWTRDGFTELPPLPGDIASIAYKINNRGQVVGASLHPDLTSEPVMWDRGRPISLGMLPGGVTGNALDINDRGEIVGAVQLFNPHDGEQLAFIWRDGVMSDLLHLAPGTSFSVAWGINNRGQVVGQAFGGPGGPQIAGAYVWDRGTITPLDSLGGVPGNSIAFAINDRGDIVGESQTASEEFHATLWRRGTVIDLGTLPDGHNSVALGINNRGEVVGQSDTHNTGHAFAWRSGTMIDLGILGSDFSRAESINERGDIAGLGFDLEGHKRAVVWTTNPRRVK